MWSVCVGVEDFVGHFGGCIVKKEKCPKTLRDFFWVTFLESVIVGMYLGVFLAVLMIKPSTINNFWSLSVLIGMLGVPTFITITLFKDYKKFSTQLKNTKNAMEDGQ